MTSFINEMKAFWAYAAANGLSASEFRLWQVLFEFRNQFGWVRSFTVTNSLLASRANMPDRTMRDARQRLIDRGLIAVKKGGLGQVPAYTLNPICPTAQLAENGTLVAIDPASDVAIDPAIDPASVSATASASVPARPPAALIRQTRQTDQTKTEDGIRRARGAAFTPPSLEDIKAYCRERQNSVNPEKWLSYYQANGWKVGRNPMRDWRAAVRTWEMNDRAAVSVLNPQGRDRDDAHVDTDGAWC